ncbi:hypothetical protein BJAS_P3122 [Bathymodiolus japonicus methanotrophic gill symbiont]|nr:hypothetical protein BJAS_P3122 [Bathymodiolus japonicus methanotrophic gill symbiont]
MFFLKVSLLLFYFVSDPAIALDKEPGWKLAKQENGISVYTRELAYSDYPEYRGEMSITANIDELLAFINNGDNCASWRYKCMKMLNLSDNYIYKLSNLPWPFRNRYTVMKSSAYFDQQTNSYTIELSNIQRSLLPKAIQAQLPEPEDTVQMRYSDGYWRFKFVSDNHTIHITYQMHGDADAPIPPQLTRLGVINSAFITLSNLKKHFTPARH